MCRRTLVTAYHGVYCPAGYYTGYSYYDPYAYSYSGPAYGRALGGVRYNDAYGPRYYRTRTVYRDWY